MVVSLNKGVTAGLSAAAAAGQAPGERGDGEINKTVGRWRRN